MSFQKSISGAVQSVMQTGANIAYDKERLANQAINELNGAQEAVSSAVEHRNTQQAQINYTETQLENERNKMSDEMLNTLVETNLNTKKTLESDLNNYTLQHSMGSNRDKKTGRYISKADAEKRITKTQDDITEADVALQNLLTKQKARYNLISNLALRKQTLEASLGKLDRAKQRLELAKQNKYLPEGGKK